MSLGPKQSYICLVPKPIESPQVLQDDDFNVEINPARSWSLLQPLTGTCLYVCISYCHNNYFLSEFFLSIWASIGKAGLPTHIVTTTKCVSLRSLFRLTPQVGLRPSIS